MLSLRRLIPHPEILSHLQIDLGIAKLLRAASTADMSTPLSPDSPHHTTVPAGRGCVRSEQTRWFIVIAMPE